ncbi:hypothetical protein GN244_ATG18970 [Phytophthora infestans]|uniref:M96 mating-specific protein family n=1 Tax=Phytophthora infestans TaxID=4787 RepID=A0A833WDA0_PHYIN|nr:hypothetical protein GN244_ATG18970 [Phytophthora infestans]
MTTLGVISSLDADEWDPYFLLETLDECIGDITPGSSPFGQSPSPSASNNARDMRRFQLTQLRKEVEDLELTLKQWLEIRSQRRPSGGRDITEQSGTTIDKTVDAAPAVWEEICKNQLCRRLKAERENTRLKSQYDEEMQVAKKRNATQPEAVKHVRRTNLPPGYMKRIAAALFEELSAGLEVCYLLDESVLGTNTCIPPSMASRMPLLRGGVQGEERTLFDRRVLPFGAHATGEAWWRYLHNYRGHKEEISTNVVVECFGVEMKDCKANTSVTSYGQQIVRRDVEPDRIVYVWNAYLEPFLFDNEQVGGIYFLEQCHLIIKPEDEDNGDEVSSCMSSCYAVTPYFMDAALQSDPRAAALVDFLVGALFFHMKAHNDMVEDLLLDQALQKRSLCK